MLSFIRAKKNSWAVKIFFGLIGFLLMVFFGAKSTNTVSTQNTEALVVNDEVISKKRLDFALEQQLQNMKTQYGMTEIPENLIPMIKKSVSERLLRQTLLAQNARNLGLITTDSALTQNIKEGFSQNGVFDSEMYLQRFLPYYLNATGLSYEDEMRKQLATSKIGEGFESLFDLSNDEAKALSVQNNTKWRFTVVKVSKFKATPKDTQDEAKQNIATVSQEADSEAPIKAGQILEKWSKGADIAVLTKEFNVTQHASPHLTLSQLDRVFDGDASNDDLITLVKLSKDNPFPDKVFEKENDFYIVKFDEKIASPEPDATAIETFKANYKMEMISELENAWFKDLEKTSKIVISPTL